MQTAPYLMRNKELGKDMPVGVGLIGLGTVGSGVVELLQDAPASLRRRKHVDFALRRVAVRDLDKPRSPALAPELLTADAERGRSRPGCATGGGTDRRAPGL